MTERPRPPSDPARAGTLLITVAGLSALLLTLSIAFLAHMRSDGEESAAAMREAQARIMLTAGLRYIQETSRLGWDARATSSSGSTLPGHGEAFGWSDVRDGSAGPKDAAGALLYAPSTLVTHPPRPAWPAVGGIAICPMYVMKRPPFATRSTFAYNPVPQDASLPMGKLVGYTNADPQPVATTWNDFVTGDPQPRANSLDLSWFRVLRERNDPASAAPKEPATFLITCGAGGTRGFRSFQEAQDLGQGAVFGDQALFDDLRAGERLMWYRAEWTSAVGGSSDLGTTAAWSLPSINSTNAGSGSGHWWVNRNLVGSFLWIQRLDMEPSDW
jgi:hypothetical protein